MTQLAWHRRVTSSPSPLMGEGREGGEPQNAVSAATPLGAAGGACSPTRGERECLS
jgi:hypothetical protein